MMGTLTFINQIYVGFRTEVDTRQCIPGAESLESAPFAVDEIPWDDLAFASGRFALEKYLEDGGAYNGVHEYAIRQR